MQTVRLLGTGLLLLCAANLWADVKELEFSFDQNEMILTQENGYDVVRMNGAFTAGEYGEPGYPVYSYRVALPPGTELTQVEILEARKALLPGTYNLMPKQPPRPFTTDFPEPEFISTKQAILEQTTPYPKSAINNFSTGTKGGFQIGGFGIAPLVYTPAEGKLELIEYIKVRLHYEHTYSVIGFHDRIIENMARAVKQLVINPEDVETYKAILKAAPRKHSRALPAGDYEWVVISKGAYLSAWQPLIDWKMRKGVRARYYNISAINSEYTGTNLAEKVKRFIDDAYNTWGTLWFLIGSDIDSVPIANCYGYVSGTTDYDLASELFFGDLYRSGSFHDWDDDNDGRYCEYSADNPDLHADCYVGRVCVTSAAQVTNFVNRVLYYEKTPVNDYLRRVLFWTEQLWSSNSDGYFHAEQLESKLASAGTTNLSYYEMYDELNQLVTDDSAVHVMNRGRNWNIVYAHGDYTTVVAGQAAAQNVTTSDLTSLLSIDGNRWGIHTGICCMSGGYHETAESYAEWWCIDREGGVASLLNSEYGWGYDVEDTDTSDYNYTLSVGIVFRTVFYTYEHNDWHIGEAVGNAQSAMEQFVTSESAEKWCLIEYNLMGDPEMPVWRDTAKTLYASHPTSIDTIATTFTVTVTNTAKAPVQNAVVCVMTKLDTIYRTGLTDASGNVSFTFNPANQADTLWVTASKYEDNYKPYAGFALIVPGVGVEEQTSLSYRYLFHQINPNIASGHLKLTYDVAKSCHVNLHVYNSMGCLVSTLVSSRVNAGTHDLVWNTQDAAGQRLPNGIYYLRFETDSGYENTQKLILVR